VADEPLDVLTVVTPWDDDPLVTVADVDADNNTVTLRCTEPGCSHEVTGVIKGRGNARFKMGTHRRAKHRDTAGSSPRPNTPESMEALGEETPVVATARAVADGVGGGTGAPNATALARGLGRALGLGTMVVAGMVVDGDPAIGDDEAQRDFLVDYLSLNDKVAVQMMGPVGKMLAPTNLNKRYGRKIVDNVDVIGAVSELLTLAQHWRKYLAMRAAQTAAIQAATAAGTPVLFTPPPVPTGPVTETTPGPVTGRVVTAADVQAARAAQ
jgi:hypothetical protein